MKLSNLFSPSPIHLLSPSPDLSLDNVLHLACEAVSDCMQPDTSELTCVRLHAIGHPCCVRCGKKGAPLKIVLLRLVVRGNLLDGLVGPPLSLLFCLEVHSSSVSHTPVPYYFPRCHPLPPPRTPHVTPPTPVGPSTPPAAPPLQYALNPRSAVGRDPRCPPVPGFPAVSLSEPCAFGLLFSAFPRLEKLDFPLMHCSFPQPACVASAPRAFHVSAVNIPRAPHKPGQSFGQGALPPPHRFGAIGHG
ncbi:hypothetical protein PGT21_031060 [Puccinia graminis f. sp. tritici]|uniref:Uncharacterized protein n=1 Tax=Puccinia graminis f. sp. tritici TaxID=56615 RepID=A0A5B0MII5_PUCGR|nr:hypothetical protein PGTUg99_031336 [Puccinia graminis f. sp. tritici]KAA1091311.1 hypothetical protein PGT21_031060 [Puccinia graminis f. sp. tritici]